MGCVHAHTNTIPTHPMLKVALHRVHLHRLKYVLLLHLLEMNDQHIQSSNIVGYPHPDLAWYQMDVNGSSVAIDDDAKYVIDVQMNQTPATFWYRMTIINIQADDYGDYICEGKNRMGNATGKVHLYGEHATEFVVCADSLVFHVLSANLKYLAKLDWNNVLRRKTAIEFWNIPKY